MKSQNHKFSLGLPHYDGLGAAVSALSVSSDTRRAAQEADQLLALDTWDMQTSSLSADELVRGPSYRRFAAATALLLPE
ncbi:hypothetical protein KBK19_05890 [Microvirga sp. STR05]|uniref:Uncharacterized protein n=1 Tax=Hymenobacter duratus TaxID=2771356 RepID=A0ABR8JG61_9BACT|nr:hypothetical protein [Hymenobacter duratus]MBD2714558.1 hypothetical protein [Hymenobacter duratus]MBR7949462.1 hypothetical protein [Microvirga sp. STR05]